MQWQWVNQQKISQKLRRQMIGYGLTVGLCVLGTPAIAAETIVLKYGPIKRSLPVSDLRDFAETGEQSRQLRTYLKLSKQDPGKARKALSNSLEISPVALDQFLNSLAGNLLLREVSEVVYPPSKQASQAALRSALTLDASDDHQISVIDTLDAYPTNEVELEVRKLQKVAKRVHRYRGYAHEAEPAIQRLSTEGRPLLELLTNTIGKWLK